ncbi:MAG: hypothetical protein JST59_12370 [Actinobacteria bacterium]|nr:hypothetical protein [Actinomycetota bacterium]
MDGQAAIDLERPRSIPQLIGASFDLYFRVPILFLLLAAIVVVPWELIVLLVTGEGPFALGHEGFITSNVVSLIDSFFVTAAVSAFHVHAVREVGDGGRPRLLPTLRQSMTTLPVVAFVTGVSAVVVLLGVFALVVPGLMLLARWAVVSQTAALEGGGWTDPFRRSADLTEGERWHAFWLLLVAGAITLLPWMLVRGAVGHSTTTIGSFAAGTALQVVMRSFEALVVALLYFDLKARQSVGAAEPTGSTPIADGRAAGWYVDPSQPARMRYWSADGTWSKHTAKTPKETLWEWQEERRAGPAPPGMATDEHSGHSLDPDVYTDDSRPAGWYVDPNQPSVMRYWHAGEHRQWSKTTSKTPKNAQADWRDLRWRS